MTMGRTIRDIRAVSKLRPDVLALPPETHFIRATVSSRLSGVQAVNRGPAGKVRPPWLHGRNVRSMSRASTASSSRSSASSARPARDGQARGWMAARKPARFAPSTGRESSGPRLACRWPRAYTPPSPAPPVIRQLTRLVERQQRLAIHPLFAVDPAHHVMGQPQRRVEIERFAGDARTTRRRAPGRYMHCAKSAFATAECGS